VYAHAFRFSPLSLGLLVVLGCVGVLLLAVALRRRRVAAVLLVLVVGILLLMTLVGTGSGRSINLVPGRTIGEELHNGSIALGSVNLLGNVAMFLPVGWLTSALSRGRVWPGLAAGLALSLTIETGQYVLDVGRAADVDDVILNTAGAALGALLAGGLLRSRRRRAALTDGRASTRTPRASR